MLPLLLAARVLAGAVLVACVRGQVLDGVTWTGRDVSAGQGTNAGRMPSVAVDVAGGRVYVAVRNEAQSSKPWLYICSLAGTECVSRDVSGGAPAESGFNPQLVLDAAGGRLFIATRNMAVSNKPWLFICSLDGSACSHHDASAGAGTGSGFEPSLAVNPGGGKVYIATRNVDDAGRLWLFICGLDGNGCVARNASATAWVNSAIQPSVALDVGGGRVFVAAQNGGIGHVPWLFVCSLEGTGCMDFNVSAGAGPDSGYEPSLALDVATDTLYIAARNGNQGHRLWLFVCSLAATGCSHHDASAGQGISSGYWPSAVVDAAGGQVVVAAQNFADSGKPWVYACSLAGTGCTSHDAGGIGLNSGYDPSLAFEATTGKLYLAVMNEAADGKPWLHLPLKFSAAESVVTQEFPPKLASPAADFVVSLRNATGHVPSAALHVGFDFDVLVSRNGGDAVRASFDIEFPSVLVHVFDTFADYVVSIFVSGDHVAGSPFILAAALDSAATVVPAELTNGVLQRLTGEVQEVGISLVASNASSLPLFEPAAVARAVAVRLSAGSSILNTSVVQVAPGSLDLSVSFFSDNALSYILSVDVSGASIPGSPFVVDFVLVCAAGTQAVAGVACRPCPAATYQPSITANGEQCLPCAPGLGGPIGSTSFLNCTCERGLWPGLGTRTSDSLCTACPPGGFCAGGTSYPIADAGYFPRATADPYTFVACIRSGCVGDGKCAPGYKQVYMCSECADGYYSASEAECAACPPGASGRLAAAIVGVVLVAALLAAFVAWSAARVANTAAAKGAAGVSPIAAFRTRTTPVTFSMILAAFQVVGILAQANFKWTDASKSVLGVFSIFNIDAQAVAAECSLASFHTTYALSIFAPLALLALVMCGVVVFKTVHAAVPPLSGLAGVPLRTLLDSVLFTLAPLLYIPIAKASLVLFDCSRLPNGRIVLDADNGVTCFDSAWWSVFPLGLLTVAAFLIGIPVYFGATIWLRRDRLFDPAVTARFGSLYRNFRRDFSWFEIANLGKRLAIVVVALFFSKHQLVQIGGLIAVLLFAGFFVTSRRPYYVTFYNDVDVRLTVVLLAILLLGAGSYAERGSSSARSFFLVGSIVAVVALVAVSVHALVVDVRSLRSERKNAHHSASERQVQLVRIVSSQLKDVEADASLLQAADVFLATLDSTARSTSDAQPWASGDRGTASVELDEL